MIGVGRPSIMPDIKRIAAQLEHAFVAVVAIITERLQGSEPELIPIAAMRLDMIGHAREDRLPPFAAMLAKRLVKQLQMPPMFPKSCGIKMLPLGHDAHPNIDCLSFREERSVLALPGLLW
jgi:hypothetical protein